MVETPPADVVLTVVGSGTLMPDAGRGSASFHLRAGGHRLLLDVGPGAHHGLPRAGLDWRAVDTIAVTHFHPDHVSDLPSLLAAYRFDGRERPLTLVGPEGFSDYVDRLAALHGTWIREPPGPLEVVELGPGSAWVPHDGALRLEAHPTPHTGESVAYRVTLSFGLPGPVGQPRSRSEDRSSTVDGADALVVGYTGDTGPEPDLHDFFRGSSVLVAECSLADPPELDTHLSPSSVAELAAGAGPALLLLSHVYPPLDPDTAVARVAERYPGRVEAARDGQRVTISERGITVDPSSRSLPVDAPARGVTVDPPPRDL